MSTVSIVGLTPNKETECLIEFQNSHGFYSSIWKSISERYLKAKYSTYSVSDNLWELWKRKDIPEHQRFTFISTFDRVYIEKKDFKRASADFRKFLIDFPKDEGFVNHISGIANFLDSEPDYPAIGFDCSLGDSDFQEYNEETDEYDAVDWKELSSVYELVDLVTNTTE